MKGQRVKPGSYIDRRQKHQLKTYPSDQGSVNKVTGSGKSSSGLRNPGSSESRPSTPVNGKDVINWEIPGHYRITALIRTRFSEWSNKSITQILLYKSEVKSMTIV